MKTILNLLLIVSITFLIVISSCSEEEPLNVPPGKATLTSPDNNSSNVALNSNLSWQAAVDPDGDQVVYDVYFGTDPSPATTVSNGQSGTTYSPTLAANTTYYWKIVAKDPNGGTSQSATWSFSTLNNGPGAVTLTAPVDAATGIALDAALTWEAVTDPDGDNVVYDVYFGTDATPATTLSADQSAVSYTPTLAANTTYYWKVVAKDDNGGSSESAVWSFTTLNNDPGVVALTAPVNEAEGVALDADLSWEASVDPDGDAVVYDVYFGTESEPVTKVSSDQTALTYTPSLDIGATYYWKVVAKDPNGGSSESAIWRFTVRIQIGDFYQGGVVFYLDETGKHGLVCPITNTSPALHEGWGCATVDGADGTAIGTGLQNTLDIIAACPTPGIAADICDKLELNGYSDWYLPSIDELQAMNQKRDIITTYALANGGEDFVAAYYYSSSESTGFYAFAYGFGYQQQVFQVGKANLNYPFRAIRAF